MTDNARHSAATSEHYTPADIVEAARMTLGVIDLDPASNHIANRIVRANKYYTKEQNGFLQPWSGRVFLNPPGGWCDIYGRAVIKKTKERGPCTETGDCGLPVPHVHEGVDSSQKRWWQELVANWSTPGGVPDAIFVCFSIELLQSTQVDPQGPLPLEFPICYPARRVAYLKPDGSVGSSPPHASAIICVSRDSDITMNFRTEFARLGHVVTPSPWG